MSIFTVGYGGRRFADFVSLLQRHDIAFVADIHRFPKSTVPPYNRESLEARLPEFGISYVSMGDTQRGFRQGSYPKHMEPGLYNTGIAPLPELAKRGNAVLMCKERTDAADHPRYIMETLANNGIKRIPSV